MYEVWVTDDRKTRYREEEGWTWRNHGAYYNFVEAQNRYCDWDLDPNYAVIFDTETREVLSENEEAVDLAVDTLYEKGLAKHYGQERKTENGLSQTSG